MSDYSTYYSRDSLWSKLTSLPTSASCELIEKVLMLYHLLLNGKGSVTTKTLIVAALGYFIAPIDAIPDVVPIVGYSDDLAIITALLKSLESLLTNPIRKLVRQSLPTFCR